MSNPTVGLSLPARRLNEGAGYIGEVDAATVRADHHLQSEKTRPPKGVAAEAGRPRQPSSQFLAWTTSRIVTNAPARLARFD
jgi:hypothetical protein